MNARRAENPSLPAPEQNRWMPFLAVLLLAVAGACQGQVGNDGTDAAVCQPLCDELECGDDGCGGTCGTCPEDAFCTEDGQCQAGAEPDSCTETCHESGFECGEACGQSCGECTQPQTTCEEGTCVCAPACTVEFCELEDGCGGNCGQCNSLENCSECALQLIVVDQLVEDGRVVEMTLAVDFIPAEGKPLPTMADVRFVVSGPAELQQVGIAPAIMDAEKELFVDPITGRPFRVLEGGIHQVLIMSTANTNVIEPGRWLVFKFRVGPTGPDSASNWASQPVVMALVEREEILAPPPADMALWAGGYSDAVVVWAQAVAEEVAE